MGLIVLWECCQAALKVIEQIFRAAMHLDFEMLIEFQKLVAQEVFSWTALVGRAGVRLELPEPSFQLLVRVVRTLREGKAVVVLPESESMTTQAAAEFLGVSRPFVVDLLEKAAIPHHSVGTHRRVYLNDLKEYQRQRESRRRSTLDDLRRQVEAAGLYEKGSSAD